MSELEIQILICIEKLEMSFVEKIANRILTNSEEVKKGIKDLIQKDFLQRVDKKIIKFKGENGGYVKKHRNHTYYQLTQNGEKIISDLGEDNSTLKKGYKTYNKSLQDRLNNIPIVKKTRYIINIPYSKVGVLKSLLGEEFSELDKSYGEMVTIYGSFNEEEVEKMGKIQNSIILKYSD